MFKKFLKQFFYSSDKRLNADIDEAIKDLAAAGTRLMTDTDRLEESTRETVADMDWFELNEFYERHSEEYSTLSEQEGNIPFKMLTDSRIIVDEIEREMNRRISD